MELGALYNTTLRADGGVQTRKSSQVACCRVPHELQRHEWGLALDVAQEVLVDCAIFVNARGQQLGACVKDYTLETAEVLRQYAAESWDLVSEEGVWGLKERALDAARHLTQTATRVTKVQASHLP